MNVVYIALFQLFLHHVNGDASYFFFFIYIVKDHIW